MSRMRPLALSALLVLLSALAPAAGKTAQPRRLLAPRRAEGRRRRNAPPDRHVPGAHMPAPALILTRRSRFRPRCADRSAASRCRRASSCWRSPSTSAKRMARSPAMTAGSSTICARTTSRRPSSPAASGWRTHAERAEQLIADPLFQVGNHTWSHRNLRKLSGRALEDEITRAEAAYEQTRSKLAGRACLAPAAMARIPAHLTVFRFPYGTCSPAAMKAVGDAGMAAIQWDVVTGDPAKGQTAERIAAVVLKHARPGSIIIGACQRQGPRDGARAVAVRAQAARARLPLRHRRRAARRRQAGHRLDLLRGAARRQRPLLSRRAS